MSPPQGMTAQCAWRRLEAAPSPSMPTAIRAQLVGSGTALMLSVRVMGTFGSTGRQLTSSSMYPIEGMPKPVVLLSDLPNYMFTPSRSVLAARNVSPISMGWVKVANTSSPPDSFSDTSLC